MAGQHEGGHSVTCRLSRLALLALCILLPACARPHVTLDRVLVGNATSGVITDVEVRHEPTMRFGAVNAILPGQSLEIAFGGGRPMLAERAVVSWRDAEGRNRSATLTLPYERRLAEEGRAVSLVYLIDPAGQVTVRLQAAP
jgi:hypothetical protein